MKSSGNTYYDKMHRLGKFVTVGSILVFCGVPLVVCLYYGIMPKIGDLLLAAGGLCAIFIPTGVAEAFGEIPVMGSSYYVANVTGNILNLKLPAALNALKVANVKSGTEAADAITGLAVAVSSLVTLVMLLLGMLFDDAAGAVLVVSGRFNCCRLCSASSVRLPGSEFPQQRCGRRCNRKEKTACSNLPFRLVHHFVSDHS